MFWYVKKQPSAYLLAHNNTCFGTSKTNFHVPFLGIYLSSAGTHPGTCLNRMWLWTVWPVLFRLPTLEKTVLAIWLKGRERIWKKEGECTGMVEIRTRKKFLAVCGACVAMFWPTGGFKRTTFVNSGFLTEGDLPRLWDRAFISQSIHSYPSITQGLETYLKISQTNTRYSS